MSAPDPDSPGDRLVIALDFGTTFSGVAYAFDVLGKEAEIIPIQEWPGLEGYRQPKVPTLIMYDENDSSKFKWGGQVNWRDPAVRGVKLLLDPDQPLPAFFRGSRAEMDLPDLPKAPVDVVADYLRAIYNHAVSVIESSVIRAYAQSCPRAFVLTVPAAWSDKAKDLTAKAAEKAGIHPITLIKEPEAAALQSLTTHDHGIKANAGGGTVDLITYKIKKLEPRPELAELVPGNSGMAGSLGLNRRFEFAVRAVVGEEQFVNLKKTVGWSKALLDFDKNIKTAFNGDTRVKHYVSFPMARLRDDSEKHILGNCWEMSGLSSKKFNDWWKFRSTVPV
ncbi:hypothetical protein DHEL01_v208126 [Diaporthe helianthi]|uniref:Hsp70-like protein n=1 Tax=Diaporthe helianthi TaxID=158607 RepID=A0A2P5HTE5_DIAHE|nr:hypothetical protein DHEL01_v208126 [Diaporthe helianthi]